MDDDASGLIARVDRSKWVGGSSRTYIAKANEMMMNNNSLEGTAYSQEAALGFVIRVDSARTKIVFL